MCVIIKVPFDAKKYFFSHFSLAFQNFNFVTLSQINFLNSLSPMLHNVVHLHFFRTVIYCYCLRYWHMMLYLFLFCIFFLFCLHTLALWLSVLSSAARIFFKTFYFWKETLLKTKKDLISTSILFYKKIPEFGVSVSSPVGVSLLTSSGVNSKIKY